MPQMPFQGTYPVCNTQPADNLAERDAYNNPEMSFTELRAIGDTQSGVSESLRLQELRKHAQQDEEYQLLRTFILNGFPKQRKQLPESCRQYWNVHQQLIYMAADSLSPQRCVTKSSQIA